MEVLDEKPVPMPHCPSHIPHGLTWDRIVSSAIRGLRIIDRPMTRLLE